MKIGYLRVSTEDQSHDRQIDALNLVCDRHYIEVFSARTTNRPVFQSVLRMLKQGDTLVVSSIDRAFRSTVDAITQADKLRERGIEFQILNMAIDTGTADGKLAYTIVAAVAEHERSRISERTKQGLRAARKRGAILGRPRKLTKPKVMDAIRRLAIGGVCIDEIALEHDVHPRSLRRAIQEIETAESRETAMRKSCQLAVKEAAVATEIN